MKFVLFLSHLFSFTSWRAVCCNKAPSSEIFSLSLLSLLLKLCHCIRRTSYPTHQKGYDILLHKKDCIGDSLLFCPLIHPIINTVLVLSILLNFINLVANLYSCYTVMPDILFMLHLWSLLLPFTPLLPTCSSLLIPPLIHYLLHMLRSTDTPSKFMSPQ